MLQLQSSCGNSEQTLIARLLVCVCVCVWGKEGVSVCVCVCAGEGWERNVALDFMHDWPFFKDKKKWYQISLPSLVSLRIGPGQSRTLSIHRTNLMPFPVSTINQTYQPLYEHYINMHTFCMISIKISSPRVHITAGCFSPHLLRCGVFIFLLICHSNTVSWNVPNRLLRCDLIFFKPPPSHLVIQYHREAIIIRNNYSRRVQMTVLTSPFTSPWIPLYSDEWGGPTEKTHGGLQAAAFQVSFLHREHGGACQQEGKGGREPPGQRWTHHPNLRTIRTPELRSQPGQQLCTCTGRLWVRAATAANAFHL